MGILSKLFGGDKKAEKTALDFLKSLAGNNDTAQKPKSEPKPAETKPAPDPAKAAPVEDDPWDTVPEEENLFNYKGGNYADYFDHVFREDFPEYRIEKEFWYGGKRTVFTFFSGASKALVVEILPEHSEAKKLRETCKSSGTPYLRYYYGHWGWWNTRSYVTNRTRAALKG